MITHLLLLQQDYAIDYLMEETILVLQEEEDGSVQSLSQELFGLQKNARSQQLGVLLREGGVANT
jgi:hypothetical protein